MKKSFLFILLFTLGVLPIHAQDSGEALAYLEQLSDGQKNISEQLMRYISVSAHSNNTNKIERKRQKLVKATQAVRDNVENTQDFYDDGSLRDAMLEYYELCYRSLTKDYKEIAAMKDKANSNYDVMKALLSAEEQADKQLNEMQKTVEAEMDAFAKKYNINLISQKDPLSEMITKSNEVTRYYNDIFLPMFKVNLQNIQLKETLQSNDIEAIEAARKATQQYAEEARVALSTMDSFDGDNRLLEAAKLRVNFYVEEANVMALNTIEYVKLNNELIDRKAELGGLKPGEQAKEKLKEYNSMVTEVNQLAQKLNQKANEFNSASQREFLQWQQLVQQFKKHHIPKYGLYDLQA